MNKRLAYLLCRFMHYVELFTVLPYYHREKQSYRTTIERKGYFTIVDVIFILALFSLFPFIWAVLSMASLFGFLLERLLFKIKLPEIETPKLSKIYCPIRFPEKYEERESGKK